MLPGDRLACLFVEARRVGERFERWPLHVTIVAWFRLDAPSEQLGLGLQRALQTVEPFAVRADGEARFGPRKRSVRLLEASQPLLDVERKTRRYLHKKRALLIDETTKRRYDFRPHVTAQGEQALGAEVILRFERLYIVEQKGDYKEIVSEAYFGKTTA
jgi:2'-5' RNA ligase